MLAPLIVVKVRAIWRWARSQNLFWPFFLAPVVALLAHLVTPTTGLNGWYAANTMRYITPMLVILGLGLAAVQLTAEQDVQTRWHRLFALGIVLNWILLIIVQNTRVGYLPSWVNLPSFAVGAAAAWWIVGRSGGDWVEAHQKVLTWVCAATVIVVTGATWIGRNYSWYPQGPLVEPFQPIYEWVSGIHGANIAFTAIYKTPLAGSDLSNTVYYLGEPRENHGMGVWHDPDAWIQALKDTCTDYLVVGSSEEFGMWYRPIPEWQWARERSDVFRRVAGDDNIAAYEFLPRRDKPAECRTPEDLLTP